MHLSPSRTRPSGQLQASMQGFWQSWLPSGFRQVAGQAVAQESYTRSPGHSISVQDKRYFRKIKSGFLTLTTAAASLPLKCPHVPSKCQNLATHDKAASQISNCPLSVQLNDRLWQNSPSCHIPPVCLGVFHTHHRCRHHDALSNPSHSDKDQRLLSDKDDK